MRFVWALTLTAFLPAWAASKTATVTYTKDVAPVLQKHCQSCHRPGEIGPMPLLTYQEARPWAKAIREAVLTKKMPPWFADPHAGKWANDRSLTQAEVDTLAKWADAGAPEGNRKDLPPPVAFAKGWTLGKPDVEFDLQTDFAVPATGTLDYQWFVVPTGFTEDKWIRALEFRPGDASVVHHVVLDLREPGSKFFMNLKPGEPAGRPNSRPKIRRPDDGKGAIEGTSGPEVLGTYTPGGSVQEWQPGQAKLIKAGSDLLFQMHYTTNGKATKDRSKVGIFFAKEPPAERVRTLFVTNRRLVIPPGAADHRVDAVVTLTSDARITGFFPHMHVRGKAFEYEATYPDGRKEMLLRVPNYDFNWQLYYYPEKAVLLPKGTQLRCTAWYDNSPNKKGNPDPAAEVIWGDQSWEEMLVGFIDVVAPVDQPAATGGGK